MKILFLDHAFHKKTESNHFFLDLIKSNFDSVDVEYIDPESPSEIKALRSHRIHDLVILWQLDYLAPLFLAAGYRTVVVPMYDASANVPYEHWIGMNGASFINFSRTLHERVIAAGGRSLPVKYYLPPVKEEQLPTFKEFRGILWMRRPLDGLTPKFVQSMLGEQLLSLHVHNAPDDGEPRSLNDPQYGASAFQITESRWSRDSNAYLNALSKANVFIAPRMSEGIGMAILEAFSRGLLVIANDDAVHNEYVANWVNGILFNRDNVGWTCIPLDVARDMAYCGWCGTVSGYQEWLDTRRQIIDFIKDTPEPTSVSRSISPAYATALCDAYVLDGESYRHFLREHVVDWNNRDAMQKVASPLRTLIQSETQGRPVLDEDGLFFGTSSRSVCSKFGFKAYDAFSAILANDTMGFSAKLGNINDEAHDTNIVLHCSLLEVTQDSWSVLVYVNRECRTRLSLPTLPVEFDIRIPLNGICGNDLDVMLTFLNFGLEDQIGYLPQLRFHSARLEELSV